MRPGLKASLYGSMFACAAVAFLALCAAMVAGGSASAGGADMAWGWYAFALPFAAGFAGCFGVLVALGE